MGRGWQPSGRRRHILAVLQQRGGGLAQFALRELPGFPRSVLNFGAGAARSPLPGYTVAAAVGPAIKWSVYAGTVHGAVEALKAGERPGVAARAPLAALAVLVFAGAALRGRFVRQAGKTGLSRRQS